MDISLRTPCSGAEEGHEQTVSHIHRQQTCISATNTSHHTAHTPILFVCCTVGVDFAKVMVVGLLTVLKVCNADMEMTGRILGA